MPHHVLTPIIISSWDTSPCALPSHAPTISCREDIRTTLSCSPSPRSSRPRLQDHSLMLFLFTTPLFHVCLGGHLTNHSLMFARKDTQHPFTFVWEDARLLPRALLEASDHYPVLSWKPRTTPPCSPEKPRTTPPCSPGSLRPLPRALLEASDHSPVLSWKPQTTPSCSPGSLRPLPRALLDASDHYPVLS